MPWTTPPGAGATVFIWYGYSLAERDRRWQAVRRNAAKAGFDCILVPLGNGVDGRYMTQLRCSAMVLPADGRAPIIIADRRSSNALGAGALADGPGVGRAYGRGVARFGDGTSADRRRGAERRIGHALQLDRWRGQSHRSGTR